jgi:hypothetical protein
MNRLAQHADKLALTRDKRKQWLLVFSQSSLFALACVWVAAGIVQLHRNSIDNFDRFMFWFGAALVPFSLFSLVFNIMALSKVRRRETAEYRN